MNFFSSVEHRHFAEQQLAAATDFVQNHPGAIPELEPGYKDTFQDITERLYIPNIKVDGNIVRARTPRSYRGKNAIGVIAARPGQQIIVDKGLIEPSTQQSQHHEEFVREHPLIIGVDGSRPKSFSAADHVPNSKTFELGSLTLAATMVHDYRSNLLFGGESQPIFSAFVFGAPLVFNMDYRQDTTTFLHEIEHLTRIDNCGVIADYTQDRVKDFMVSEQRAYYVEHVALNYISRHGLSATKRTAATIQKLEDIRARHLGEGSHFGFSHELADSYIEAGLIGQVLFDGYHRDYFREKSQAALDNFLISEGDIKKQPQ